MCQNCIVSYFHSICEVLQGIELELVRNMQKPEMRLIFIFFHLLISVAIICLLYMLQEIALNEYVFLSNLKEAVTVGVNQIDLFFFH